MPHLPRNKIVDRHEIGIYHCISRVVRSKDLDLVNATADALQSLMRHKSYLTTQRYVNLANQIN